MKKIKLTPQKYKELQERVLSRDEYKCVICSSRSGLQIHHIIKRSKCRIDELNNLITLCYFHHNSVELNKIKIRENISNNLLTSVLVTAKVSNYKHVREYKINEPKK